MAEENLSLIPYASGRREVVLRHGSAVVLYNEESRRISLRTLDETEDDIDISECPYCGRPLDETFRHAKQKDSVDTSNRENFVDPGYFRMLHHSRETSKQSSRSSSPQLRLVQAKEDALKPQDQHAVDGFPLTEPDGTANSQKISADAFSNNYFKTFFVEERELGRGGKGVVLLVRHVIDGVDLGRFACKRIPVGDDSEWLRKVLVEVQLLQKLSHPNLVAYRHVWLENFQTTTFSPIVPCTFILQQYCNSGDLHHYIFGSNESLTKEELKQRMRTRLRGQADSDSSSNSPRHLPFEEIFSFFRDITSGLHYLHRKNYIHRDLKPSNCLLHRVGAHTRVLVSDFGEMQGVDAIRKSTGHTGTISFCAPEVLKQSSSGVFGNFSQKSDIFSLGLIVHLMCFGRLPYANADTIAEENEDIDLLRNEISAWAGMDIEQRDRQDLPEKLYRFLKLLLSINPDERPTTEDILQSIKVGSSFYEHTQHRAPGSLLPPDDPIGNNADTDPTIPAAAPFAEIRTRRASGLSKIGVAEVQQAYSASRRPSSPRVLSVSSMKTSTPVNAIARRSSSQETIRFRGAQRLLGPPTESGGMLASLSTRGVLLLAMKTSFFCIKIYICLKACFPMAPKPSIVIPLLVIAGLDLTISQESFLLSLVLFALHMGVIAVMQAVGTLCESVVFK